MPETRSPEAGSPRTGSDGARLLRARLCAPLDELPASLSAPEVSEAPLSLLAPTWVLVGATVFFGIFTSLSVGLASAAARMLLGVEL